ncbi:hypothetical protein KS4_33260 [Poriferisphaera corsica]|uniref:Uncharacterized protein n=1 Tax=Poriferisphaera corsica TaxID=2528020 RepID=A0A517YYE6_9BACT|nr:hypothetical protein [Poriferisphaera corsica]QDU35245.1 hypothetical protein KS4_33260 [Poriferisphaera corsica]
MNLRINNHTLEVRIELQVVSGCCFGETLAGLKVKSLDISMYPVLNPLQL